MPTLFFAQTITLSGLRPNCVGSTERFAEAPPTRLCNLLADSSEAGRLGRRSFHACRRFARYHIRVRISDIHLVAGLGGFERAVDKLVRLQKARLDLHPVSEIAPDDDRLQDDLVVAVERGDLHPFSAEKKRS